VTVYEYDTLYDRVIENLEHSAPEIKKLAPDALDIKFTPRAKIT
jgi:hypothetical protein